MSVTTERYGWTDAVAPHTASFLTPAIDAMIAEAKPRDILDAGCGNGALVGDLTAKGHDVIGIDADAGGIDLARAQHPQARFMVATFDSDPKMLRATPDGLFDMVVSTEVIEHLYDPVELVRFAYAALRPGGTFVVSTPYHGYWKNLVLALTDKWDSHLGPTWHGGHIKFWSRRTLSPVIEDAGFRVTGFRGVGRFPYLWKSMILTGKKP